ncbi:secretion protein snm4, partial [Streptomyces sp. RSD-27]
HRGMALATLATAVSAGAAGVVALTEPDVWTVSLASAVAAVLWLRARAFPLVAEVVALLLAGGAVAGAAPLVWAPRGRAPRPPALLLGRAP